MATTYLTRTPPSDGNLKTMTFSLWIKRSKLGTDQKFISTNYANSALFLMNFNTTDTLTIVGYSGGGVTLHINKITNRVFRDTSAWYHLVVALDSTNATAEDRCKIFINGERETSFGTNSNPTLDRTFIWNKSTHVNDIGHYAINGANHFDGSMSHFHFIDGTAYDATAFGQYDANGVWKPILEPSVTYGTNGFFILKDGNSVTDQSGNGNNYTVGAGTLTKTEDNPSNVFCTFNALAYENAGGVLSNGNTRMDGGSSAANNMSIGTLAFNEGKYYAEFDCDAYGGANPTVGIVSYNDNNVFGNYVGQLSKGYGYTGAGAIYNNGAEVTATGTSYTSGDIIGVAVDCDNNKIYWYKNGTLVNSGGTTIASDEVYTFAVSQYSNTGHWLANFGNGYFGTTAVASAGTNASGIGIFEYDVPTGYTALSTKGLNL